MIVYIADGINYQIWPH